MMRLRLHLGGQCGYGTVASYHRHSDAGSEKGNCEPLLRTAVIDLADGQHCNGKYVSRYLDTLISTYTNQHFVCYDLAYKLFLAGVDNVFVDPWQYVVYFC